ncbi:SUMF1/EgtB/PvdO family nonheme iron enzyme [Phaeodactylibacter xiamenensis]|uniref:SUMF1/EgtB/PvdO family nonheme iron enzyme n=1 Tax=Phaeodactylibacter xiamenensis TaxID=1524460 RepID=UPI0024A8F0E6|nr:SUMF1/EgtB/PvdO family nonheme iron enzyme [Phaeodactylibacter xiamenensis]
MVNSRAQSSRSGQDRALFFAVSNYEDDGLTDLPQPVANARAIAKELTQRFGFKTEVVEDPTLGEIQAKLAEYQRRYSNRSLPRDGQLFIFFSGHGKKDYGNGYFLPADADPDQVITTGLAYNIWRPFIDGIPCKHILVAVDACFSVTFDPAWQSMGGDEDDNRFKRPGEFSEAERLLANHQKYPSRLFYTSDAQEDIVPGRSNFARKLLDGLANSYRPAPYLTAKELFAGYVKKAQPTPNAGDFGQDDVRSSFLFFYKTAANVGDSRADRTAWQEARGADTAPAYRQYLQQYPNGDFRPLAEQRLAELVAEERELIDWETAKRTNTRQAYQSFIDAHPNSLYRELAEHKRDDLLPEEEVNTPPMPGNMAFVKGGTFQMGSTEGSSDKKPVHSVTVSDFYIGRHEVTFEEYDAYCEATGKSKPNDEGWGRARRPVINVSWNDVVAYCNWRSQQEGYQPVYTISGDKVTADWSANGYRLPTEAEWEFAARERGKEVRFGNGKDIARASELNFDAREDYKEPYSEAGIYRKQTVSVSGLNSPNRLNLYDMSGNVWEWCWDWFDVFYRESPSRNPRGPSTGSVRVLRGGSWIDRPTSLRCTGRYANSPNFKLSNIGFRLARTTQ